MLPQAERLKELFLQHLNNSLTHKERQEFYLLVLLEDLQPVLKELINNQWDNSEEAVQLSDEKAMAILRSVISEGETKKTIIVRLLQQKWLRVAALFILLALGAFLWYQRNNTRTNDPAGDFAVQNIQPGKTGATLTLSDGTITTLDSLGNTIILDKSGAKVIIRDGELQYDMVSPANKPALTHTITTARGNQFHLILPDGTKVWLNAASSITYPLSFTKEKRTVQITGEVYFEVTKLSSGAPFVVTSPAQKITVLGTHFNVNTYEENSGTRTTLIEGKVRVSGLNMTGEKILLPGQQSIVKKGQTVQIQEATDMDQVMAWHQGYFYFTNTSFAEIMKQLSRWYDIDIHYEGKIPDVEFEGKINRSVTLAQVLTFFKDSGIRFKMENKTLYIL